MAIEPIEKLPDPTANRIHPGININNSNPGFHETKKILDLLPVGVCIVDRKKTIRWINHSALLMLGENSVEEVVGKKCHEKFCPSDEFNCPILDLGGKSDTSARVLLYKNSKEIPILKTVFEVNIDQKNVLLEVFQDMSRLKKLEDELKFYATTDLMTGTLNRRAGISLLEEYIQSNLPLTICYTDINNLKRVNDTYGHKEGDQLILCIIKIFKKILKEPNSICRLGGDEFLLIFPNSSIEYAFLLWKKILNQMDLLNKQNFKPYPIHVSGGFATYNIKNQMSIEKLLDIADKNMYIEKKKYKKD